MHAQHFVDDPAELVLHALQGLVTRSPGLHLDAGAKVVYRKHQKDQVALISGGGSGHEPAHAGFVADGMLSGAVCGSIFASPSASQIRRALDILSTLSGTLLIVKNYTGDVLNFGLAKERFTSLLHNDPVKMVIVADDVAVTRSQSAITGRRGLAGTVLVHKISGALAASGANLERVTSVAQYVSTRLGTIGIGTAHVHVPGTAAPENISSTAEIGMGIHNEPGAQSLPSPLPPLSNLICTMVGMLLSTTESDPERGYLPVRLDGKDEVVLLVNNLGGVGGLEMDAVTRVAVKELNGRGVGVKRICVGTYITSLNMPGFSLTLLLLPREGEGESKAPIFANEILSLLHAPTSCLAWTPVTVPTDPSSSTSDQGPSSNQAEPESQPGAPGLPAPDKEAYISALRRACEALIAAEPELTHFDTIAGDGDCGLTFRSGAQGILAQLDDSTISGADIAKDMRTIAKITEDTMGGTAGALCSIFFSALAAGLVSAPSSSESASSVTSQVWSQALQHALKTLLTYTRARPPDSRTLIDPLAEFVDAFSSSESVGGFEKGVKAAAEAAERTKGLEAKAGRAAYVESKRLEVPDPGAWAVMIVLKALQD